MIKFIRTTAFPIAVLAALSACGGGGGGGGNTIRDVPFTSFSVIGGNERVTISGLSQTATATHNLGTITGFALNPINESESAMALTYDRNRNLSGISIGTPQSSVSFGAGEIDCSTGAVCAAISADVTSLAAVMNPFDASAGWNYQTFGVWLKDVTPTSSQLGAISVGAITPGSAVPLQDTFVFNGHAGGFFTNPSGSLYITDATMTATANFSNQQIVFSTTDTFLTGLNVADARFEPNLNLSGNLSYAVGSSQFAGTVTNASSMSGPLSGRFFGPNAEEIGGIYNLTGSGGSMVGAFGGKR